MQVLDNDDKPYLYVTMLGREITSRAAVLASCTYVLDNDDKPYLYVRSGNYVTCGSPCVTYASLRQ
jgi:hypothetical protein